MSAEFPTQNIEQPRIDERFDHAYNPIGGLRSKLGKVLLLNLFAASSTVAVFATDGIYNSEAAVADTPAITLGMGFEGRWAYSNETTAECGPADSQTSHPSCHETYSGDWSTDLYGASGTDVKLKVSGGRALSFSWDTASGTCGETRRIKVLDNGAYIGRLSYTHLSNAASTNSAPTDGMTLGKIANLSCNPGGSGKHVHLELENANAYSCYVNYSNERSAAGITLSEGSVLGVLGSANTGAKQACSAESMLPPTPANIVTTLSDNSSGPISSLLESSGRRSVFTGSDSGRLYWSHWAPGGGSWSSGEIANTGSAIKSVTSLPRPNGKLGVYFGTADGHMYEAWYAPSGGWVTHEVANTGSSINGITAQAVTADTTDQVNVYYGTTDGKVRESWWRTGLPWTTSVIDTVTSPITDMAMLRPTTGTDTTVYVGTTNGEVHEDWWAGPGELWRGGQKANFGTPITSLIAMMSGATETVYAGTMDGNIKEAWFTPGSSAWSTGWVESYGRPVTSLTGFTTPSGVVDIFAGTMGDYTLNERFWWPGNTWSGGRIATLGRTVMGLTSMQVGTAKIVYSMEDNGAIKESWWAPGQSGWTTSQIGTAS
jgi:hypothetical protein